MKTATKNPRFSRKRDAMPRLRQMRGKRDLLFTRQSLDLALAALRLALFRELLIVKEPHGTAAPRILRAPARIVRGKALLQVVRPSRVERTVCTDEDVSERLHLTLFPHGES